MARTVEVMVRDMPGQVAQAVGAYLDANWTIVTCGMTSAGDWYIMAASPAGSGSSATSPTVGLGLNV